MNTYTPLVPNIDFKIDEIFSIHYFEYTNNYLFNGEQHDFWEFCFVDKGEIEVTAQDTHIVLKKPQIIFHKPNEFHSLRANGCVAPNLVVASFTCRNPRMKWFEDKILTLGDTERRLLARMLEEASLALLSPLDDPELKQLERRANAPPGAEQLVKICLEWMLVELYRKGQEEQRPTSLIREKGQQDLVDKVIEYMQANVYVKVTLTDICRDNVVGRSHLQKIFREKTGGGAMEYFGRLKIEAAKRMIREGHHNFTEISVALGYTTIHYFSRHFKKIAGMTPSEYASSVKILAEKSGTP